MIVALLAYSMQCGLTASAERKWKSHTLTQTKLHNRLIEENMQKLVHVSSALTLQKKQNQELTNRIADLSKFNSNVIHRGEDSNTHGRSRFTTADGV
jgi:hypothetical protein